MDVLRSNEPLPQPADGEISDDAVIADEAAPEELVEESGDAESEEALVVDDSRGQILTITEKGFGKRTPVPLYRLQSRGGYGVKNINITEKNGKVAGLAHVTGDEQILLITEQGMIIRVNVSDLRTMGRSTQGVRVINVDEDDRVVSAVKLMERDDENGDATSVDGEAVDGEAVEGEESALPEPPDDGTVH